MGNTALIEDDLRKRIISEPDVILEDIDLMRALVAANERALGSNVVDLRGIAMERLEARLDRLEDTHRSVIAAAYENLASTNQVHRAILTMMEPSTFESFVQNLGRNVAETLRVDSVRLVLETQDSEEDETARKLDDVLSLAPPGFVASYLAPGRDGPDRQVTLRQSDRLDASVHGDRAAWLRSEACLKLDLGRGRMPGMLALGAEDPNQFSPAQGTELLGFFCGVFERCLRNWLA
ncbi:DUF484 family protein [Mesobaculum littorinae]|uniref:DUF484 family protein n=1 Tax=Mesobaculum littorinae TaxID=2486419 RepID=A0A438AIC9_9RHOB|nr:DUF484 family protein [Mesobaculum littorinae]RVV98486.1 DUF484 family protein [Mesobaculum littorinae]